jgi:hypothetical protein
VRLVGTANSKYNWDFSRCNRQTAKTGQIRTGKDGTASGFNLQIFLIPLVSKTRQLARPFLKKVDSQISEKAQSRW